MTERHLIEPHPGDKRYVRRDKEGQFKRRGRCRQELGRRPAPAQRDEEAAE